MVTEPVVLTNGQVTATLYCGDCLEILPTLGKVDAVVTDPPYGIALENHAEGKERRAGKFSIIGDGCQTAGIRLLWWAEEMALPTIVFASPSKPWPGKWRSWLVWDKGGAVGGGGDTKRCWKQTWEMIQVSRTGPLRGSRDEAILRYMVTPQDSAMHPAQKPVALMGYLIEKATLGTVLDPFMGSGTTGVACARTGRDFIGIEISEDYFAVAVNRIKAAIQQPNLFGGQNGEQSEGPCNVGRHP